MSAAPSADEQLAFLTKLQRVFAEGEFSSTYKFALLIALAELAVELGQDNIDPLELSNQVIASKFIDLYWQQAAPYSVQQAGAVPGVLIQNNGVQAAVIKAITSFRVSHPSATPLSATALKEYRLLCQQVAQTVSAQPIAYLQNLGGQTQQFLYERVRGGIILKPGVTYCLRRFQPLVQQLARRHWIDHLKRNRANTAVLGQTDDLESFLFETSRQSLMIIGEGLKRIGGSHCFYCRSKVQDGDVDHFIPFSLYPRDLAHNFVISHPACNRSKSDTLAAKPHLESWMEHITKNDDALREIGEAAGRTADLSASHAVARWGYSNAVSSGARAWIKPEAYEAIDSSYLGCLA
ncbi:MAG: HNH endonuclease [Rhodoferax sp.]|uniref:HNH endonuclease n=1 Tax=Rhodoferax sp. TaxID=50421 RepID=UPI0030161E31